VRDIRTNVSAVKTLLVNRAKTNEQYSRNMRCSYKTLPSYYSEYLSFSQWANAIDTMPKRFYISRNAPL